MIMENRLKKGLGRGLSSLLGDSSKKINTNKISIKDITRNKLQPRKHFDKESLDELANSIKKQGVIQPIVVRPDKSPCVDGSQLASLHRRAPIREKRWPSRCVLRRLTPRLAHIDNRGSRDSRGAVAQAG